MVRSWSILLFCYLLIGAAQAQKVDWVDGIIVFRDSIQKDVQVLVSDPFLQGTVVIRIENEIASISTLSVLSLRVRSGSDHWVLFENVVESLPYTSRTKNSFMQAVFKGKHYSLYSKFIAAMHIAVVGVGLPGFILIGTKKYYRREEVLFIAKNNGPAYQFTFPINDNGFSDTILGTDKRYLFSFFENPKEVKRYVKKHELSIYDRGDLAKIFEYADMNSLIPEIQNNSNKQTKSRAIDG